MDSFRSIVTELFFGLVVIAVGIAGIRFARQVAVESGRELKSVWNGRRRTQALKRTAELLGQMPKSELEQLTLRFWLKEFRLFHERAAKYQMSQNRGTGVQGNIEESQYETEEAVKATQIKVREMSRDELLEVIDTYVKELTDKGEDSYQQALELINAAGNRSCGT